jgi:hypothetical protein
LTASDWFSGIGFFFVGGGNQARFDIVVTCYFC